MERRYSRTSEQRFQHRPPKDDIPSLTGVAVSTAHVQDIVSPVVSGLLHRFHSKLLDKGLDLVEIAVTARQQQVFDLLLGGFRGRHAGC